MSSSVTAPRPLPAAYAGLEPGELWRHFGALNAIPRASGHESAARAYVEQVAELAGASHQSDARGNLVVRVAGTVPGAAPVAIQAHLDMVCEASDSEAFDPLVDAIRPAREDDRIVAPGTTLGADNGIGVAAALAVLTTPDLPHGPLELLFTVEEETGLDGAMDLDPSLLSAKRLINLDSEDPGELTIGCAGANTVRMALAYEALPVASGATGFEVSVSGLRGGHSGVDIDKHRANAVVLLARALDALRSRGIDARIGSLDGGGAHNVIPRRAVAGLAVLGATRTDVQEVVADAEARFRAECADTEPALALNVAEMPPPAVAIDAERTQALIELLVALPHGVVAMSERFPGTVHTSANLAGVRLADGRGEILASVRSLVDADAARVSARIAELGAAAGARTQIDGGYPGWEPDGDSPLLAQAVDAYEQVYGRPPGIGILHGGLECGVIVAKVPGMDAVSFGPLITGAHSPEESVDIESVKTTWELLVALLARLVTAEAGPGGGD